jgi:hypothetical protein
VVDLTEKLLKLSEFPFSYSLIGIIVFALRGKPIDLEHLPFAEVAPFIILLGFLATTLTITDPFGRLLRWGTQQSLRSKIESTFRDLDFNDATAKQELNERSNNSKSLTYLETEIISQWAKLGLPEPLNVYPEYLKKFDKLFIEWRRRAIKSSWISIEVDKIVSTIYFAIVLITFGIALFNPIFIEKFAGILQQIVPGSTACTAENCLPNANQIQYSLIALVIAALAAISYIIIRSISALIHNIKTVTAYLIAIDLDIREENEKAVAALKASISSRDWELAKSWAEAVRRQILDLNYGK